VATIATGSRALTGARRARPCPPGDAERTAQLPGACSRRRAGRDRLHLAPRDKHEPSKPGMQSWGQLCAGGEGLFISNERRMLVLQQHVGCMRSSFVELGGNVMGWTSLAALCSEALQTAHQNWQETCVSQGGRRASCAPVLPAEFRKGRPSGLRCCVHPGML
jgi:hypothetical protein